MNLRRHIELRILQTIAADLAVSHPYIQQHTVRIAHIRIISESQELRLNRSLVRLIALERQRNILLEIQLTCKEKPSAHTI